MFTCACPAFSNVYYPEPPGHRYWRINISANNGSSGLTIILEIELRNLAGVDQTTGLSANATASSNAGGSDTPNWAFADDAGTKGWATAFGSAVPSWIAMDFGAGNAKHIASFSLMGPTASAVYAPKDFKLQWSDDNSAWTDAITVTNQTGWGSGEIRVFS